MPVALANAFRTFRRGACPLGGVLLVIFLFIGVDLIRLPKVGPTQDLARVKGDPDPRRPHNFGFAGTVRLTGDGVSGKDTFPVLAALFIVNVLLFKGRAALVVVMLGTKAGRGSPTGRLFCSI